MIARRLTECRSGAQAPWRARVDAVVPPRLLRANSRSSLAATLRRRAGSSRFSLKLTEESHWPWPSGAEPVAQITNWLICV